MSSVEMNPGSSGGNLGGADLISNFISVGFIRE